MLYCGRKAGAVPAEQTIESAGEGDRSRKVQSAVVERCELAQVVEQE